MILKYDTEITDIAVITNINRLINQIYKLLPSWEEGLDWRKPLTTIIEEISGMSDLFLDHHDIFLTLLCKLQGLFMFSNIETDFFDFRRIIFECLSLLHELKKYVDK